MSSALELRGLPSELLEIANELNINTDVQNYNTHNIKRKTL